MESKLEIDKPKNTAINQKLNKKIE